MLAYLGAHGVDLEGGRVSLLTNARVLGYVFNPLSVYYCHRPDGELRCVVAEVHNTYGERHCYLLEPGERGRADAGKEFYVSPFLTVDGRYRMSVPAPGERLSVQMALHQEERRVFSASLTGRRLPLTNATVARMLVRHPLMTGPGHVADPHAGSQALAARRRPRPPPAALAAGARGMTVAEPCGVRRPSGASRCRPGPRCGRPSPGRSSCAPCAGCATRRCGSSCPTARSPPRAAPARP